MKRLGRILAILILFPAALSAIGGWFAGPMSLHPIKRPLTASLIREAEESLKHTHGTREDIVVRAPDGALLRGWKVRAESRMAPGVCSFTESRTTASASSANPNSSSRAATPS